MGGGRFKLKKLKHGRLDANSESLYSSTSMRRMSRARNAAWSLAFRAGVAMGVTLMPKVAAADVKAAVDTVKKKDKVRDTVLALENLFEKQKDKNMTVGATAYLKESKDFLKAVDAYLSSFPDTVKLKGNDPAKITALNKYLGVKEDGKTPNYIIPATLEALENKMVELNATLSDPAVNDAASDNLAGMKPTVVFEKPAEKKEPEVVPKPVEEKEMSPIYKKLLERIDEAIALCDDYSLPAKNKAKLEDYRTQVFDMHEKGKSASSKFIKDVNGLLSAIDMRVDVEKKKMAEAEPVTETAPTEEAPVTVEEAEKAAEKKAATMVTSDLQKSSDYMSLLVFVTDKDKPIIFKKLFAGKYPNNLLKQLSKYHTKLEKGEELSSKEKKKLEGTFAKTEKWIVSTLIPTLEKYSSLLVGEPKKVYEEKMNEINKHIETKEVKKGKKTKEVTTIKDAEVSEVLDILAPAESEQQKFSPLYVIANEYYLIEETLYFIRKRSSQYSTKALKKQDKDTWKQLKSINKQASKLYSQLGSKKGPGDITFQTVAPLLFELEVVGRKANMDLLENEKDSVVAKKPLSSSINALINQIVQIRLARVEVSQNKQSPTLDGAKDALEGAIQLAKDVGMEETQEFAIFFEEKERKVPVMKIAENLLKNEKDPARIYEAAQTLLAIAEAQIWINNSSSLGWVHNTEKELQGAEESLKIALITFEWNFANEKPLTNDISISRRFAYNTMHVVSPLMLEYEKYLFAENQQTNEEMIKDGVETAVALKDKKESDIKLMSPYFLKQPQLFGPGVGRGVEAPYVAHETEESIIPAGNGVVVGELERQEDWLNGISKGKYDETYNKLVELSLEYGNIARGIQQEYESALQFLTAISALKEKELSQKVDEVKIIEAKASVSQVDIPLTEFQKNVNKYKEKLAAEKIDYEYNKEYLQKKYVKKYMKENPAIAEMWTSGMDAWEKQMEASENFIKEAEEFIKNAKDKETVKVGIDPDIFNAVKWIDSNVDQYDKILTIPQQIALLEAGLDAVVIPEKEGEVPPLQPVIPVIDRFSIGQGLFPLMPQLLAIQSTQPEMNFNLVYSDTDVGVGIVDEIAGNAPDLYGSMEKAGEVLTQLADAYGVSLSGSSKKSAVKNAANDLLEVLPDSLLGVDADKQSIYQTYKEMIEEAASTGNKATLRAAIEGLAADENIGGGLNSAIHVFHLTAKKNSILYQPMGAEFEMWFSIDKEALKAIQQDERIKFTTLGVFLKFAVPYLNYPGSFEEFLLEKTDEGIEQVPTGEKYPAEIKEVGGEATLGVAATTGKAVFTIRTKMSITHQAVEGKIPTAYDEETGEPTEYDTKTQSGTFFSLDFVDASVTLPNGKVFKGLGIAFLTPVAGEIGKGEVEVPQYNLNPMLYSTFGWNAQNDKLSGGIYVQPGVALYGKGIDAFTDPSKITWFTSVHGNLLIKIPDKDQALNITAGVSATGNPVEDVPVTAELKGGFEYYIKKGDLVIAPTLQVGGDPVTKQWGVFGGLKLFIPELLKKK